MKDLKTGSSLSVMAVLIILLSVCTVAAQQSENFVGSRYMVTFQIPKDVEIRPGSTEQQTIYFGKEVTFGLNSALLFAGRDAADAEKTASKLSDDSNLDYYAQTIMANAQSQTKDTKFDVLEKKRVKLAGLNALKLVFRLTTGDIKFRRAVYMIPVPDRKQVYAFTISALDANFDKWFPVAEASVNSLKLLKE